MLCIIIRIASLILMSTLNIPFQYKKKKKITLNYPKSAAMGFFSKGLKKEFETAVVNDPSVFEPLKVYCYGKAYHKKCSNTATQISLRIRDA